MPQIVRAGAVSHVGRVRSNNQDSGFIGTHIFGVADGMGGHAGGDVASAIAVKYLAEHDEAFATIDEAEAGLADLLYEANELIISAVAEHSELKGMGTTADVITQVGDEMVIGHIGDSRVYRFHHGKLSQVTNDHTFVQRLVDAGRITPEEALVHPRRSVLMRVLGDVETSPDIDVYVEPAAQGDRWLLCSDGLSSYVSDGQIAQVLGRTGQSSRELGDDLIQLALDNGAPDNVTVVVLELGDSPLEDMRPKLVGSAVSPLKYAARPTPRTRKRLLPDLLQSGRRLAQRPENEEFVVPTDEVFQEIIDDERRRKRWRRVTWLAGALLLLGVVVGSGVMAYNWTQTRYYVGVENGQVVIYQGVQATLGPLPLSGVVERSQVSVDELPQYQRDQITNTISFSNIDDARSLVDRLEASTNGK